MIKKIFAALLLCVFSIQFSSLRAEDVVRLEPVAGAESDYRVADLLRVELNGDYIRFIAQDGTPVAEVYKYDYVKLTIADKEPTAVEQPTANGQQPMAGKVIMNGQVYILLGDKAYLISGEQVK
jgi:hypothetical protein